VLGHFISHHCTKRLEQDSYHILLEPNFFCGIFLRLGEFFSKQQKKKRKRKENLGILFPIGGTTRTY
jgi:hypothetical protein